MVIDGEETHLLGDASVLQLALVHEETAIAVQFNHLGVGDKLTQDSLMLGIVAVHAAAHLVEHLVPEALGVEHKARLEQVGAENHALLTLGLQHLPKLGRQEYTSLCVRFCYVITYESHSYECEMSNMNRRKASEDTLSSAKIRISPQFPTFHANNFQKTY